MKKIATILTIPASSLRQPTAPVVQIDKKLQELLSTLKSTLIHQHHPPGVGLAAPQIGVSKQVFVARVKPEGAAESGESTVHVFINPSIIDRDEELVTGPTPKKYTLEGCLSIPRLYGPVPRSPRVKLKYFQFDGIELTEHQHTFTGFDARVIQHELDHLHQRLFIDYTFEYNLPIYQEDPESEELVELDPSIIQPLVVESWHGK